MVLSSFLSDRSDSLSNPIRRSLLLLHSNLYDRFALCTLKPTGYTFSTSTTQCKSRQIGEMEWNFDINRNYNFCCLFNQPWPRGNLFRIDSSMGLSFPVFIMVRLPISLLYYSRLTRVEIAGFWLQIILQRCPPTLLYCRQPFQQYISGSLIQQH